MEIVIPVLRSGYKQYAIRQDCSGRESLRRDVGGYAAVSYTHLMRSGAPLEVIENLQEMEDEGEIYESIEDIWPDYPSKEEMCIRDRYSNSCVAILLFSI